MKTDKKYTIQLDKREAKNSYNTELNLWGVNPDFSLNSKILNLEGILKS